MSFWLSRNNKNQFVIGTGDKEVLVILVEDIEWAKAILACLNYRFQQGITDDV